MTVVVDTSVLIDHLRGDEQAHQVLRKAVEGDERLACSVLTRVEILAGMRAAEEARTRRLLDSLEWIDVDAAIAERAGQLANEYMRRYPGVDVADYVIAATAEALEARLCTRTVKHFPMIADLQPPY